jgi:hypothetical protein
VVPAEDPAKLAELPPQGAVALSAGGDAAAVIGEECAGPALPFEAAESGRAPAAVAPEAVPLPWEGATEAPANETSVAPPQEQPGPSAQVGTVPAPASEAAPGDTPADPDVAMNRVGAQLINEKERTFAYGLETQLTGDGTFFDFTVTHRLPAGVQYLGSDPPAEVRDDRLTWHLHEQEPGARLALRVRLRPAAGAQRSWEKTVFFDATYTHRATHPAAFAQPRLVVKTSGPQAVLIGEEAVLRFEVSNERTWPASATRARIQFPSGLSPADGETIEAEIGDLAPGDRFALSPHVRGIRAGRWEVTAEATCAEQAHAASASEARAS